MKRDKLRQSILIKLEPTFDKIILVIGIIAIFAGIILYIREFIFGAIRNTAIVLILFTVYFNREKIPLKFKAQLIIFLLFLFSIQSIYRAGFIGNGLLALAGLIIIALTFFTVRNALILGFLSIGTLLFFTVSLQLGVFRVPSSVYERVNHPVDWLLQAISLTLFLMGSFFSIYSINSLLLESLEQLYDKFDEIREKNQLLHKQQEELEYLAFYDSLTDLPNRHYFFHHAEKATSKEKSKGALLLIVIKDFQMINSTYGSGYGDHILKIIGNTLQESILKDSVLARIGGNEFALWISAHDDQTVLQHIATFSEIFKERIMKKPLFDTLQYFMAYSKYPSDGQNIDSCYRKAIITLMATKETNFTVPIAFHQQMEDEFEEKAEIRKLLEIALKEDEFSVHYQPKIDVRTQRMVGMEALARWHSKTRGFISPKVFIPIINHSNLIEPFSETMIKKILKEITQLSDKNNENMKFSINISPLFFLNNNFEDFISMELSKNSIHPKQIILEITEDIFINDSEVMNDKIKRLRNKGFKISLDDFGTGYSSLKYLTNIIIDEIKIDKSFIDNIVNDHKAHALLKTIVAIGETLDYEIVAEGVETIEQIHIVSTLGCHTVQGYIFSKPIPMDEIINKYYQKN